MAIKFFGVRDMYFEQLTLHQSFSLPPVTIRREQVLSFAQEFDPLPIHLDEEYAKRSRYGKLLAPGVMTFMLLWAEFHKLGIIREEMIAGKGTHMEWHAPVFLGDTITATAEISNKVSRNDYNGLIEVTVKGYNQQGHHVITDWTEAIVMKAPKMAGESPWGDVGE